MPMRRNQWIDAGRGSALLLMLAFHWQVDRIDFFAQSGDYRSGAWWLVGKASVILFLFLAGLVAKKGSAFSTRNLRVGGAALLVTTATYLTMPDAYVRFGILHLLTVAGCGTGLLCSLSTRHLMLAAAAAGSGFFLPPALELESWVFGPGTPAATIDHYPLFPWLAFYLLGLAAARHFGTVRLSAPVLPAWLQRLACLGRHTLLIYLVHQPFLLLALSLWYR